MKKTCAQLRERNTNFRSSFARANMNGAQAKELEMLNSKVSSAEETLIRVRKEQHVLEDAMLKDKAKLDNDIEQLETHETSRVTLISEKEQYEEDIRKSKEKLDDLLAEHSKIMIKGGDDSSNQSQELQYRKMKSEVLEMQTDKIEKLLVSLTEEFPELKDEIISNSF